MVMADQAFDHRRRSSVVMYDPARDIFTAAEDAIVESDETSEATQRPPKNRLDQRQEANSTADPTADEQQIKRPTLSRASVSLELALAPRPNVV